MTDLHEGWSIRVWASWQTRNPKPKESVGQWHSGYEPLNYGPSWDLGMPEIPLHIRYKDFTDRLDKALKS